MTGRSPYQQDAKVPGHPLTYHQQGSFSHPTSPHPSPSTNHPPAMSSSPPNPADGQPKMSEPSPLSTILEPLALVVRALYTGLSKIHWSWWTSRLASLFALPFRVLAVPLKILFGVLYVVFAPVIYVLAFLWSIVTGTVGVIVSLEPLYTFFGVAAFIGILTGLVLAFSSSTLTSNLNLQDSPSSSRKRLSSSRRHNKYKYLQDSSDRESSSPDTADWKWVETSPVRRKPARGLLSQTIHEEDDSSDAAL